MKQQQRPSIDGALLLPAMRVMEEVATTATRTVGTAPLSMRERMLWAVLVIMFPVTLGGGVTAYWHEYMGPHPQLVAVIERVERIEEQQQKIADIARRTLEIVEQAHPVKGRVGVPPSNGRGEAP